MEERFLKTVKDKSFPEEAIFVIIELHTKKINLMLLSIYDKQHRNGYAEKHKLKKKELFRENPV